MNYANITHVILLKINNLYLFSKPYLGQITELAERLKTLEDTEVVKLIKDLSSVDNEIDNDIMVVVDDE